MIVLRGILASIAIGSAVATVLPTGGSRAQGPGMANPPETAKIVGVGAASCSAFLDHVRVDPGSEREYLVWAQGFMSGALLRAPDGIDRGLDLLPPRFPISSQAIFLRRYCEAHPRADYSDGVVELFRTLRSPPS
jgi:hypothetical protein